MDVTMSEQQSNATRTTDAAMALAHAATATHAMAEMQAAEDLLRARLEAEDARHVATRADALDAYRYSIKAAIGRYTSTMAKIRGADNNDDED